MSELKIEQPKEFYPKGDEFKEILFAKMKAISADGFAKSLTQAKIKDGVNDVWCKNDRPIHERIPLSFLLSLWWQLTQWGCAMQEIKVSDEDLSMMVNSLPVVKAVVDGNTLQLTWFEDFGKWDELMRSPELSSLIASANEMLSKSSLASFGKGGENEQRYRFRSQ